MKIRGLLIGAAAVAALGACSNGGGSGSGRIPTYKVDKVSPNGYLDLGLLLDSFKNFPEQTIARQVTQSVQIVSGSPRDNLAIRIYKGGFLFEELPARETDLLKDYTAAQQPNCDQGTQVTMITADGYTDTFNIMSCSKEQITIQNAEEPNSSYTFQLLDPMSLKITKRYEAMDNCFNANEDTVRNNAVVETVRLVRWGDTSHVQAPQETVSLSMLQTLTRGVSQAPASIASLPSGTGDVAVPAGDLKALHEAPLRPDVLICPGLHIRPPSDSETSTGPVASPAPEPDYPTAPGGSPEPVPAPTPAPTPTPAPAR
ncbi:MAG TPA: hypothetical protein VFV50_11665 [Bdellovibrionales bacterium]|nr:hypothetical protein [Bdellovibrionales bacterium]